MISSYNENARSQNFRITKPRILSNLILSSGYLEDTSLDAVNQEIQRDSNFYQANYYN